MVCCQFVSKGDPAYTLTDLCKMHSEISNRNILIDQNSFINAFHLYFSNHQQKRTLDEDAVNDYKEFDGYGRTFDDLSEGKR